MSNHEAAGGDTNAEIWNSPEVIASWTATAAERERERAAHWGMLARFLPYSDQDEFRFADLGAGTGAASRIVLEHYPRAHAVLTDFSDQMLDGGRAALAPFAARTTFLRWDLVADPWPAELGDDLDAVITSLSVHHLPDERKRSLFGEIAAHLRPGGWYLNYDPVVGADEVAAAAYERIGDRDDPSARERREHRGELELARWANHVRYMIPLAPQLGWLREAGFVGVDVYWKYLENTIFGGMRPR